MKNRIIAFILLVALALCLSSCTFFDRFTGNNDAGNTDGGNTDGGNTDGGNTDGGNTDNGNTDSGNTNGGNTDSGNENVDLDEDGIDLPEHVFN